MTDRELMQQALDALEEINKLSIGENAICLPAEIDKAMDALRERLAQPDPDFYGYASRLAAAIWEQHHKDVAPQWKPLDDLIGVLTQIDNMTAGLTRLAQPEQEPVSGVVLDEHGSAALVKNGSEDWHCKKHNARRLYTTPPQGIYYTPPQRKPLTDAVLAEREACAAVLEANAMACENPIYRSLLQANAQAIREMGQP